MSNWDLNAMNCDNVYLEVHAGNSKLHIGLGLM